MQNTNEDRLRIGCAGWGLRSEHKSRFPDAGSHLQRYAAVFNAVEVNSCFYRSHRKATWARWAESTPPSFQFSYKLPRSITHQARLKNVHDPLCRFLDEVAQLGKRQGILLIQLPPSFSFEPHVVGEFFTMLRRVDGSRGVQREVACEPRHASWFTGEAIRLLSEFETAGVAAHPPKPEQRFAPFGFAGCAYFRLHGAPHIYHSAYSEADLRDLAIRISLTLAAGAKTWCVFDNTAEGHAVDNALRLLQTLRAEIPPPCDQQESIFRDV